MPSFSRKLWKWIAGTFAVLVILLGLGFGLFRIALEQVPDYRAQIQAFISKQSGLDIAFSSIDARWRFYGPELVFENAVVGAPNGGKTLVAARRGSVALDIWGSLASGRLTTGRFWLDAPQLFLVRTAQGRIELVGQDELPERTQPFRFDDLPTGRFSISDARVTFRDLATGRGPWTFARVGLTLARGADSMHLEGTVELPSALGRQLEFSARSSGHLEDPEDLHWDFAVESSDLALSGLGDLLPETWPLPATGNGSFKLAGVLKGLSVEALSGNVSLAGIQLPLPTWTIPLPGPEPLVMRAGDGEVESTGVSAAVPDAPDVPGAATGYVAYDLVRTAFNMQRTGDGGWHLVLDGLQLVRPGVRWDPSRVELDVDGPLAGPLSLRGTAGFVSLEGVWPLLALLPERDETARLRALAAAGRVRDFSFSFKQGTQAIPPTYSFAGTLDALTFSAVANAPGIAGLSGQFVATDQSGKLDLAARNFQMTLPRLFREPLHTDQLDGTITWAHEADHWRLASDGLQIRGPDGKGNAKFAMVLPDDDTSPILDLEATAADIDATATPRYLPAGRLTTKSLAWLDRAFPAGKITSASVQYHGPARKFPFRDGEGTFVARAQLENFTLDYSPGWTPLTGINGEAEFRNAGLIANVTTGQVHDLHLTAGQVSIADLKSTELDIRGKVSGDLGAALDYLQRSPIGPAIGDRFMALEGTGEADINARLWLPLKQVQDRKIDVTTQLVNAEIGQRGMSQKLTGVNGSLQVLDRALASPGLQGRFLGGPVSIAMSAEAGAAGQGVATVVSASGRAMALPIKELLGVPDVVKLTGAASWRMQARFVPPPARRTFPGQAADAGAASVPATVMTQSYVIDSDLLGFGIGLPDPVQKAANTAQPLHVEVGIDGGSDLTLRGSLGQLRTVARLQRENGKWAFDRAGVRADGVSASIPDHEGIRIEGDLTNFVLDDWLALKGNAAGPSSGRKLSDYLKAANVRIGTFGLFGYEWQDVRGLLQATNAGWQVDVAGPEATGKLLVPYDLSGNAPLTLEMEHLVIASKRAGSGGPSTTDPRQVPPIEAHINEFELGGRQFGDVRAQLERAPRGLTISNIATQSASFSIEIRGEWLTNEGATPASRVVTTEVDATLTSTDVQPTLKALGYGDIMAGTRALLQAKLNWPGGPDAQALGRASGTVHIEIEDGQVLELQPGAGRVLGLLSVAALPRRLSFDFSDLTDKGLAFDSVRGDFELRQGNAFTNNLLLTGPAADIGIAGRTGLGARDYDQTAVVTGNIGATLPVAGVLAGGPVVGAAMLLFSQVFKEPLNGMTRGYYRITGNWDEPQVERVVASDAKESAAQAPSQVSPTQPSPESPTSP